MALEIERKYLNVDLNHIKAHLEKLNATFIGEYFESNIIFDTAGGELFSKDWLLRVRTMENAKNRHCLLTLKKPVSKKSMEVMGQGIKVREELETAVSDEMSFVSILKSLGYLEKARYEKVRSSWTLPRNMLSRMLSVTLSETDDYQIHFDLDRLPFMKALEIEARPDDMPCLENFLGLDKKQISSKSYHELHQAWLSSCQLPCKLDFVFAPDIRIEERRRLGLEF